MLEPENTHVLEPEQFCVRDRCRRARAYLFSRRVCGCSVAAGLLARHRGRDRDRDDIEEELKHEWLDLQRIYPVYAGACIPTRKGWEVIENIEKYIFRRSIWINTVVRTYNSSVHFIARQVGIAYCPHSARKSSVGDWVSRARTRNTR